MDVSFFVVRSEAVLRDPELTKGVALQCLGRVMHLAPRDSLATLLASGR